MSLKKKIGAVVAGLALAGGAAVVAAPAAQADYPDLVWFSHDFGGLGGNIGYARTDGVKKSLPEGSGISGYDKFYTGPYGGNTPRYIYAGGGYCIWEQVFVADNTTPDHIGYTRRLESNNWGKRADGTGYPSGTRFEAGAYKYNYNNPYSVRAEMAIYRC